MYLWMSSRTLGRLLLPSVTAGSTGYGTYQEAGRTKVKAQVESEACCVTLWQVHVCARVGEYFLFFYFLFFFGPSMNLITQYSVYMQ